jgi:hypothetical protein
MEKKFHRDKFLNAFMSAWMIHKKGEPSDILIETYWIALKQYDIEQVKAAFSHSTISLKWFPKPAELIELLDKPKEHLAYESAGYLINAITGKDYKNPDGWKHEITTSALLRGRFNISKLRQQSTESDLKWIEKDFIKAYLKTSEYIKFDIQSQLSNGENSKLKKITDGMLKDVKVQKS